MSGASNPFRAAFENDEDAADDTMFSPSPYQLGSVYGEDTMSLLDNEVAPSSESRRPRRPAPAPPGRGGAGSDLPKSPASERACLGRCTELVLCAEEARAYSRIGADFADPRAARLARWGFAVHWVSMLALVVNVALFTSLLAGPPATAGLDRAVVASFGSWVASVLCALAGSLLGWLLWARPLRDNLRSAATPSWRWFSAVSGTFLALTGFLLAGIPGTGSGGVIMLVELRNWEPRHGLAIALNIAVVVLHSVVLVTGLVLLRWVRQYVSSTELP